MGSLGVLHDRLHGRLWHTTRPNLFASIIASGGLSPEPDVGNAQRWKTSRGPEYYPFVRKIGGVSLFDFRDFDAERYAETHPMSNWRAFVPHMESWRGAVWIEIDRDQIADSFVSADEVVKRWDAGGHHRHTIMPRIEAAHIGILPREAFLSAFLTWASGEQVREISTRPFDSSTLESHLGEWRSASA